MADDIAPITPLAIPVSTTFEINGHAGNVLGPCFGVIARSMGFARGVVGGVKSLKKGNITEYSSTLEEGRREAVERMVDHAVAMGANAVTGVRFDSSDIADGIVEIVAYGTAVVVEG
jgi:uncharacterized protein YbjQ (UPF0145 family)